MSYFSEIFRSELVQAVVYTAAAQSTAKEPKFPHNGASLLSAA
jgi:hypothetical protein